MNEIRKRQYELELYADLLERAEASLRWYQHADEETGEMADDTDENSKLHCAACRSVIKAIMKAAGV